MARAKTDKAGRSAQPKKATFQSAVQATPALAASYRAGIQALNKPDKNRLKGAEKTTGSIALDDALKQAFPSDNRWDYGIGLPAKSGKEKVLWLEVHHSSSGQAAVVSAKLSWLKSWLVNHAPALDSLEKTFVWLVSNVEHNPRDRLRHRLAAEKQGLRYLAGVLDLAALAAD